MTPSSLTVNASDTATFQAAASGTPAPSEQWEVSTDGGKTFKAIPGADDLTLSFEAKAADNGFEYEAVFTNPAGSVTTSAATLTVDFKPDVTTQPDSQTVAAGSAVTLHAAADGNPAPTVQWQVSTDGGKTYTNVSGATSTTLSFTAPSTAGTARYRAVFTNALGTDTTRPAVVTTDLPPAVTAQPTSLTVNAGDKATFHAAASGTPDLDVQWQVSTDGGKTFKPIPGAHDTTLAFGAQPADNGNEYEAVFTNPAGSVTTSAATLTVDFKPDVTTQPDSQTVAAGSTVTLHAAADGNPTPTVQWQVSTDGGKTYTNVSGATSDTLSFTAPSTAGEARYRAVFTNALGTDTTRPAVVTTDIPPTVTTQPTSLTVNAGQKATFHAAASGTPDLDVQWQVSADGGKTFKPIPGAHHLTLSFKAKPADNGNEYEAVFTNPVGTVTTSVATLTVDFAPDVTTQPDSQTVAAGSAVTLHAAASGNPAPTVQWQVSTDGGKTYANISGATSDTLSFTAPSTAGKARYRAVFTNSVGTATTKAAVVTTDMPPAVTTQPSSLTVKAGRKATFHAAASGTQDLDVQWEVSTDGGKTFKPIPGADDATLSFMATAADNGNEYEAVFTNPVGTVTTSAAKLTVS
jgi:hypothetical protein